MKERLVLIESNTSGTGRHFAAAARSMGLDPVLVAEDPSRYPYVEQDGLDVVRVSRAADLDEVGARIDALARDARVAGIYSSSEYFIETAAELARRRGLPGPDPQAVRTCRNKGLQRRRLKEAGVGIPGFVLARSTAEALAALPVVGSPAVAKPTEGTGSRGVRLCRGPEELEAHATALLAARVNERGLPIPAEVLVEEYVRWPEFSAEFFGLTLLGVVRKHVSPEPYFVEVGHDVPAPLDGRAARQVGEELRRALRAVGACWGPTHVEFRYDGERCAVMEINPRLAGGFIPELVRLATGVDAVGATVALAAGRPPDLTSRHGAHAAIRFIRPRAEGRIAGFRGLAAAAAVNGVTDVQTYRKPGDDYLVHNDFRDRVGHVIACGDAPADAVRAATSAQELIEVELECRQLPE